MIADVRSRFGAPGEGSPVSPEENSSFLYRARVRLLGRRGLFEIYAVDGDAIRGEPSIGRDIDFTNWGEHYRFPFIPLYEIWLDQAAIAAAPEDEDIFVDASAFEWRLMAAGASYDDVWQRVERYEAKERRKRTGPLEGKPGSPTEVPAEIYLGTLGVLDDGTVVKLVHAKAVQDTYDDDFTEGGHWRVYKFIPGPKDGRPGEEWIGDDIFPEERPYLVIHETDEEHLMGHGMKYDPAHKRSSELEWYGRHHPDQVAAILSQLGFRAELPGPALDARMQDVKKRRDAIAQSRHIFRFMLKQRRQGMGKGNRVKTRGIRPGAWLYPYSAERAYSDRISKWLAPLRRQVVAHLRQHGEALLKTDAAIAFPSDPTVFSPGPGKLSHEPQLPQHPVTSSMLPQPAGDPNQGRARPDPAAPGSPDLPPFQRWHHRTIAQFLEDLKRPYLQEHHTFGSGVNPPSFAPSPQTHPLPISTEQPPVSTPPQEEGVEHYDRTPGSKVTTFVRTTQGWVAQQWPENQEKAPASIMMGLGESADAVMATNVKEWAKHTTRILGLSFSNTVGDWWPDLRTRWADRNYDLIKRLARDYIGRINDHVERAVTNGWSYKSLMKDIQSMGEGMTGGRARLIARDQVGKLNGQLTQAQQTEVGIDAYEWDTAGDERVRGRSGGKYPDAVPSHWAMQGMLCRWDDASVYSDDGGRTWHQRGTDMPDGHPGDDIQCRCTAIPQMSDLLKSVDRELDGEPEPREKEEAPAPPSLGEVPTAPAAAAAYLSDVVGWTPLLLRGFTKAAPESRQDRQLVRKQFPDHEGSDRLYRRAEPGRHQGGRTDQSGQARARLRMECISPWRPIRDWNKLPQVGVQARAVGGASPERRHDGFPSDGDWNVQVSHGSRARPRH